MKVSSGEQFFSTMSVISSIEDFLVLSFWKIFYTDSIQDRMNNLKVYRRVGLPLEVDTITSSVRGREEEALQKCWVILLLLTTEQKDLLLLWVENDVAHQNLIHISLLSRISSTDFLKIFRWNLPKSKYYCIINHRCYFLLLWHK